MSETSTTAANDNTNAAAATNQQQPDPAKPNESANPTGTSGAEAKTSTETKPGETKTETTKTTETKTQETTAPEKYELKLPENALIKADQIEKVSAFAKQNNLTNDQAQALLNQRNEGVADYLASEKARIAELNDKGWAQELLKDKEFGGEENLKKNGELAAQAATEWFGEEFVTLIKQMGINHHPLLFKGLVRLAKASESDRLVHGNTQSNGAEKRAADIMYPTMNQN